MKKTHTLVHLLSKILAFIIRWILRSRYSVSIKGADIVQKNGPVLFLPNHQALTDPIILMSYVYKFSSVSPVISEKYYDVPIAKWYFRQIGAVRVSDLESGNRDTNVLKVITRSVYKGFKRNKNVVIYPAGQLAGHGYEKIFNKKSVYHIVNKIPDDVQIVGVRLTGLWGSMFSKARTPKSPDFFLQLLKGLLIVFANLIFFVPKRKVSLEFVDLTKTAKEQVLLGQKPFNLFLEEFFNVNGEEQALFLKHFFYSLSK
ncbi:MAG: 1-acyl-sn-glycerol-3-phosphate acyltransferase [Bacteroidales bacterium]|nr:1-acyl-sn-glycerol-3-phosphate acyltransferase [Bacteroidales bacterium]